MIRAERLSKSYRGVPALTDVTFDVAPGEAVAISGGIGSAPSVLLRILATLIAPASGTLHIAGVDAIAAPFAARRKLFWAGNPVLMGDLSIAEYVDLAGTGRRRQRVDPAKRASVLARAGVARIDTPLSALADGQRRLVDLAVAALSDAALVLVDDRSDTTASADRDRWLSLFSEVRERGATCVVTTTDAALPDICDRLLSLEAARAA